MRDTATMEGKRHRTPRGLTFYVLVVLALINLVAAAVVVGLALSRMQNTSSEIIHRTKVISAVNQILSIARDSETGQRGYLLTGNESYLDPYRGALDQAPAAWRAFYAMPLDPLQVGRRDAIRTNFDQKLDLNRRTIAQFRAGSRAQAISQVQTGQGKEIMDRMRAEVAAFQAHEQRALTHAERRSAAAMRLAAILTIVGGLAFIGAGALMFAAVRRARADAGSEAARALSADMRFKATFDQSGVGFMHIDKEGRPLLVNDAMCEMTGYSRAEFVTATPETPAFPSNLFSNKANCDALIGGEIDAYRHARLTRTKDGREIYLASVVSAVRDAAGGVLFLSAVVSDLTDQYVAERNLRDSQERLRRLQDEFAHVARVNDLGEMAAAIAHEVNQPLTAINNYLSVAGKMAARGSSAADMGDVVQRAGEQALRAGQIIKRMRSFVERTEDVREIERVGTLIASAVELTLLGTDRDAVAFEQSGNADAALVRVDPIQFQQALIILMRNAIEAFSTAKCPGKCHIHLTSTFDASGQNVCVDVSDNGPGLPGDLVHEVFKPFVTSKPGNMGMGLSIARRLIDSHGGRLTMESPKDGGATFRITIPLVENNLDQAA